MAAKKGIATPWLHKIMHDEPVEPAIVDAIYPAPAPRVIPIKILRATFILFTLFVLLDLIDNRPHNSIDFIGYLFKFLILEKLAYH
jgi:hypothetical protein